MMPHGVESSGMKHHARHPHGARPLGALLLTLLWLGTAFAGANPPGHASLDCASCHLGSARAVDDLGLADRSCARCHDPGPAPAGFHAGGPDRCTGCHSFHEPENLKAGGTPFAHAVGNDQVTRHCAACHAGANGPSGLTDGHRAATALYHGQPELLAQLTPSEACLLCHSRDDADPRLLALVDSPPRFHAHASHPNGAPVAAGGNGGGFDIRHQVDARLPLIDGRMECATCHDLTDDLPDRLVRFDTPMAMCLGCHERGPGGGAGATVVASRVEVPGSGRPRGLSR